MCCRISSYPWNPLYPRFWLDHDRRSQINRSLTLFHLVKMPYVVWKGFLDSKVESIDGRCQHQRYFCVCVIAANSNELATTTIGIKRDSDVITAIRWGGTITLNDDSQAIRCQERARVSWGRRKTDVQEDLQGPSGSELDQFEPLSTPFTLVHITAWLHIRQAFWDFLMPRLSRC